MKLISLPIAAATTIRGGCMVSVLATGTGAVPAGTASSGRAVGIANETVVNTAGLAGAERVTVECATGRFNNSADADLITIAHIGQAAYIVDDETVALTDDDSGRQIAGAIVDVDSQGVWVEVSPGSVMCRRHAQCILDQQRAAEAHQAAADAAINAALNAGKISPGAVDYHRASCSDQAGLARFLTYVGAAENLGLGGKS